MFLYFTCFDMTAICNTIAEKTRPISSSFPCCCLLVCSKLPEVPHAHVSEETRKAEYEFDNVIHFTCETGYISGPTIRYVCTTDGWFAIHQGVCYCELNDFPFCFSFCCNLDDSTNQATTNVNPL